MTPLVSILIPAYNAARWLPETLRSALAQTWPKKEIILVDDGSSDDTAAIARSFASEGVTVVSIPNGGAATARNRAFALSRGDYIQWLDADDLLAERKIELQIERARQLRDPLRLISSPWAHFFYEPDRARFSETLLWADLDPAAWLARKMQNNLHMQTATWLTHRSLAEAAGPWDPRMVVDDDGEYFCRVLRRSTGVAFVREARVYYRNTPGARLSYIGRNQAKMEAMLESIRIHIRTLLSLEDNDSSRAAGLAYLRTWQGAFYPERPDIIAELRRLASQLGGELPPYRFRPKYAWLVKVVGARRTKHLQLLLPHLRARLASEVARVRADFGSRRRATTPIR